MHARSIALVAPMLLWSGCLTAQRSVGPGAAADAAIAHPYRPGIDVLDYNLSLELPARGNEIAGDAVLSLRRTASELLFHVPPARSTSHSPRA